MQQLCTEYVARRTPVELAWLLRHWPGQVWHKESFNLSESLQAVHVAMDAQEGRGKTCDRAAAPHAVLHEPHPKGEAGTE
jgi:hypothetical protein